MGTSKHHNLMLYLPKFVICHNDGYDIDLKKIICHAHIEHAWLVLSVSTDVEEMVYRPEESSPPVYEQRMGLGRCFDNVDAVVCWKYNNNNNNNNNQDDIYGAVIMARVHLVH